MQLLCKRYILHKFTLVIKFYKFTLNKYQSNPIFFISEINPFSGQKDGSIINWTEIGVKHFTSYGIIWYHLVMSIARLCLPCCIENHIELIGQDLRCLVFPNVLYFFTWTHMLYFSYNIHLDW